MYPAKSANKAQAINLKKYLLIGVSTFILIALFGLLTLLTSQTSYAKHASIILYGIPSCPYCNAARRHFEELGVQYRDCNVQSEQCAKEYMRYSHGQNYGVPLIVINNQTLYGYDKAAIDKLLLKSKSSHR